MLFTKKEMKLVLKGKLGKIIQNEIIEVGDWFTTYKLIFKIGTHYYQTFYSEGLYEKPFAWEEDIEANEITRKILAD